MVICTALALKAVLSNFCTYHVRPPRESLFWVLSPDQTVVQLPFSSASSSLLTASAPAPLGKTMRTSVADTGLANPTCSLSKPTSWLLLVHDFSSTAPITFVATLPSDGVAPPVSPNVELAFAVLAHC